MAAPGFHGWEHVLVEIEDALVDVVNNVLDEIADGCKEVCPVDTGTLVRGYKVHKISRLGETGRLTNDVDYHNYVNDGTPTHRGHHMVEHGIGKIGPDANKYIRR